MMPDMSDPLIAGIGAMAEKAWHPPTDVVDELSWRVGYQNAISDLIAELWPDAEGGRRVTCAEMEAADERRRR